MKNAEVTGDHKTGMTMDRAIMKQLISMGKDR
jgi:hypothetical protein